MRQKNATNQFLKECMADALFQLLKEKSLDEISITEITKLANVGRVTFYRNFTKKEDLITYKLTILKDQFDKRFPTSKDSDTYYLALQFFSFIYDIKEPLTILYHANLLENIFFPIYESLRNQNLNNPAKLFQSAFIDFGIMGILVEWITNGFQESPEELLEIFKNMKILP